MRAMWHDADIDRSQLGCAARSGNNIIQVLKLTTYGTHGNNPLAMRRCDGSTVALVSMGDFRKAKKGLHSGYAV